MPELPEVETMRRGILPIVGCCIEDIELPPSPLRPIAVTPRPATFRRRIVDREIVDISRRGKRVLLVLDSSDVIVFEPRMTGLVLLADPPTTKHLRVRFLLSGGKIDELLYWDRRGLGSVRLYSPRELEKNLGEGKLGPDALEVSPAELRDRLKTSRRAIKVALLDQRILAGVGNLYASEILHLAAIHPEKRCDLLARDQWEAIHSAMVEILTEAIRSEGSTLSDGTYRNALNQAGSYQNQHRVYDRADQACPSCRQGRIVRIVQTQRSTFFCPACQPKRHKRVLRKPAPKSSNK